MEPVFVFGLFTVLLHIHERRKRLPGMVEHGIQQYANSARMAQLEQSFHGICVTEVTVYPQIVLGIIFMIGGCLKDRCEVNRINAQLADVIQMVDHALKVTAEEVERCRLTTPRLNLFGLISGLPLANRSGKI